MVTSLAEVWIETSASRYGTDVNASLPLRKCGLKLVEADEAGVPVPSLPLRKCGLKPRKKVVYRLNDLSLPLRKCGLKQKRLYVL